MALEMREGEAAFRPRRRVPLEALLGHLGAVRLP
jgi:hypothetical protein